MNRRRVLSLAVVALSGPLGWRAATAAAERPWMKYSEIAELFEKFESVKPERRANLSFHVKAAAMNDSLVPAEITLSMALKQGRVGLPVDAKGVIAFPIQAALREEDPLIYISTPTLTKVALMIDVLIKTPPERKFKYADMMLWVKSAGDAVRQHAGIWALFTPKPDGLELEYPPGQTATAHAATGEPGRIWNTNAKGKLVIPLNDDLLMANPDILLSAPPEQVRPHFGVKMQLISTEEAKIK